MTLRSNGSGNWLGKFNLQDVSASLVVFLVAVPLALGIANASGAPIAAGLIGCIVGGIVAGLVGGAPLQVSGPAAGLTVLVYGMVQKFGWTTMCAITLAAGIVQICFGVFRIARICLMISPAVVHGMLAGIGATIALAQFQVMVGGSPKPSALANFLALPQVVSELVLHSTKRTLDATILGLITIAILVAWTYVPPKLRLIPGGLVAVFVATILGNLIFIHAPYVVIQGGNLFALNMPGIPADMAGFVIAVFTIAVVASVESLLCAVATDQQHTGPRANLDRELIGQGLSNSLSGLLGGLPVTGVIVRSSANVAAGAKTQLSAILHGVWVLIFVMVAASLINRIPLTALAALLVHVGIRLINAHHIKELTRHREIVIYVATALGVAFLNLLVGVAIGIGLALGVQLLLRKFVPMKVSSRSDPEDDGMTRSHVSIDGGLSFLTVPRLTSVLAAIPTGSVVIHLNATTMDHAAFVTIRSWKHIYEKSGGSVEIIERESPWFRDAVEGRPRFSK